MMSQCADWGAMALILQPQCHSSPGSARLVHCMLPVDTEEQGKQKAVENHPQDCFLYNSFWEDQGSFVN